MRWEGISFVSVIFLFKEDILLHAGERGICFCTAQFSTAVCAVHLSVRLGLCPTLLAMRWPFSLGISNLHNHCWLLWTGLSHCLSVWLETPMKKCRLPKKKKLLPQWLSPVICSRFRIYHFSPSAQKQGLSYSTLAIYPLLHQLSINI